MEEKPIEFTPGWVAREEVEEKGTSNKGKLMSVKQKNTFQVYQIAQSGLKTSTPSKLPLINLLQLKRVHI